jgi:hypothetical protein
MEILAGLKQMESTLSMVCDHTSATKAKLDDLLFRAQRIAANQKAGMGVTDTMFGYDLQGFRRSIRVFSGEISGLPVVFGSLERSAVYDEKASKFATAVARLAMRLSSLLRGLHDTSLLAHQHIRTADHKIEAFYLANEIEELVMRGQGLPTVANKIVIITQTPPQGGVPAAPPAEAPAARAPQAPSPPAPAPSAPEPQQAARPSIPTAAPPSIPTAAPPLSIPTAAPPLKP